MRVLLLTLCLSLGAPGIASAHPAVEGGPCASWHTFVRPAMPLEQVVNRTKHTIRCAVGWVHGVPGGIPMAYCIADRESSFYPWAQSSTGSSGVYQFISSTWASARDTFRWLAIHTIPSVFSMRSNVLFFARYAHTYGLSAWGGGCG